MPQGIEVTRGVEGEAVSLQACLHVLDAQLLRGAAQIRRHIEPPHAPSGQGQPRQHGGDQRWIDELGPQPQLQLGHSAEFSHRALDIHPHPGTIRPYLQVVEPEAAVLPAQTARQRQRSELRQHDAEAARQPHHARRIADTPRDDQIAARSFRWPVE